MAFILKFEHTFIHSFYLSLPTLPQQTSAYEINLGPKTHYNGMIHHKNEETTDTSKGRKRNTLKPYLELIPTPNLLLILLYLLSPAV